VKHILIYIYHIHDTKHIWICNMCGHPLIYWWIY